MREIDARPYQAALDREAAELKAAEAQLQRDDADLARAKASLERQAATAKNRSRDADASRIYEQAQARRKRDQETSVQRHAALNTARINLAETNIVSPIDGVVVARDIEAGQTVAADAAPLFLVAADLEEFLHVSANIGEKDIGDIKPGDKVSFEVEAIPNRAFTGEVTRVDRPPEASQNAANYSVVISAPNDDLSLKPGMRATIRIGISRAPSGAAP